MDLSKLSTDDLLALRGGDLSRVSTAGLQSLRTQQERASVDPTNDMGTVETLRAGIGRGMASAARGVGNLVGLVSDADVAEAKRLDSALLGTTAGKVGNVVGLGAAGLPAALIPGANATLLGSALTGAGVGALTTEGDAMERLKGGAFGAAGGAVGKVLGDAMGAGARALADRARQGFAGRQTANAQRVAAAQAAQDAGFVVPPADIPNAGAFTEALSGLSGKIKTAQVASARNQDVTNSLARRAVGIADDAPLTAQALADVRVNAGKAYDAVRGVGTLQADQQYSRGLDALGQAHRGVMPDFPQLARSDVQGLLGGMQREQFDSGVAVDAIRLLRSRADQAFRSGDNEMGRAAKAAAGELEQLIERNLSAQEATRQAIGKAADKTVPPGRSPAEMLQQFRDARQLMAKTYTLEKALNSETGDVSAAVLARELGKGKPLSGDLRTIGEVAAAFPKALQSLKEAPKATSPLDWALAGFGNPLLLGARPVARSLLLSPAYQRAALAQPSGPGALSQLPAGLLDQDLTRRALPSLLGITAPLFSPNE